MITIKREYNPVTGSPRYVVFDDGVEWFKVEHSTIIYCQDRARTHSSFIKILEEYYLPDFPNDEEKVKQAVKLISKYFEYYYY